MVYLLKANYSQWELARKVGHKKLHLLNPAFQVLAVVLNFVHAIFVVVIPRGKMLKLRIT